MLILTRRPGQRLRIGDEVIVQVCGVKGNQVSIGIIAPRKVPIDRAEVVERRKTEGPKKK